MYIRCVQFLNYLALTLLLVEKSQNKYSYRFIFTVPMFNLVLLFIQCHILCNAYTVQCVFNAL
jgi:hypothetical protein